MPARAYEDGGACRGTGRGRAEAVREPDAGPAERVEVGGVRPAAEPGIGTQCVYPELARAGGRAGKGWGGVSHSLIQFGPLIRSSMVVRSRARGEGAAPT